MRISPPLILLSGHRAGAGGVMGALAAMGLHLGPVVAPGVDSPKGGFRSGAVVQQNAHLLAGLDRDWTNPPIRLPPVGGLEPLRLALEASATGDPWGFNDPLLLFTMPAWLPLLAGARVLGVYRPIESTAASIAALDGLPIESARDIAALYATRLLALHREIGFPILRIGDPRLADNLEWVAGELGLGFDAGATRRFLSPYLLHQSASAPHELEGSLGGESGLRALEVYPAPILTRAWHQAAQTEATPLRFDLGPTYQRRVGEMWSALRKACGSAGRVVVAAVEGAAVLALEGCNTVERALPEDLGGLEPGSVTYLLAPGALDSIAPGQLGGFLQAVWASLDPKGCAAVSGFVSEEPGIAGGLRFEPIGVLAGSTAPPYFHLRDEIEVAVLLAGLHLLDWWSTPGGRTWGLFAREPRRPGWRAPSGPGPAEETEGGLGPFEAVETAHRPAQPGAGGAEGPVGFDRYQPDSGRLVEQVRTEQSAARRMAPAKQRVEKAQRRAAVAERRAEAAEQRAEKAEEARALAEAQYLRLIRRRSVRLALALARLASFLSRRRRRRGPRPESPAEAGPGRPTGLVPGGGRRTAAGVIEAIRAARPTVYPTSGPLVSIIVLSRDGAEHLRRLLPALDTTAYRSFEVLVVDNASTDDTARVLELAWSFPLRHLRNEYNASFSDGNNQAVAESRGEFVLLLNNDIEPITDQWLGAMVAAFDQEPEPAAVGALLVYPELGDPERDLTVQHRGLSFGFKEGMPLARNLHGDDPTDPALSATFPVPGATGAVLAVRRSTYETVGGLTSGYVYGIEDVDFSLKLRACGGIVVAGAAALFHHEGATHKESVATVVRVNRMGNWRRLAETWGPRITRSVRRDVLGGSGVWTGGKARTVAITVTDDKESRGRGDYYTAHGLGEAFAAEGWNVLYAEGVRDRWYRLPDDVDLVVSLLDTYDVRSAPEGAFTIAWVRSWIDRWLSRPWFDDFDLVVTSSDKAAGLIAAASGSRPPVLPLAADPGLFHPGPPHPSFVADVVFTGNNWGVERKIIPLLDIHPDERFLLFGKNWDRDPRMGRYWRGHVPHQLLAEVYRSVKIVLDDTVCPLEQALLNTRVFEALASGALVITDNVEGSGELFDGLLPTYRDRFELRRQLNRFLADDEERCRLAGQLRQRVLEHHTYARRARGFCDLALAGVERPRVAIRIAAPNSKNPYLRGDFHFARSLARALRPHGFLSEVQLLGDW
ncbi:MAG TPA: glycosyltransferase, partial [Acidimicrobiia bacterium]|nr:glycosyltransferase [Acidimicrobiia bacterium]